MSGTRSRAAQERSPEFRQGEARRRTRWIAAHPGEAERASRRSHLKKYGLTLEEHDRLLEEQGGVCAICKGPSVGRRGQWFDVDHDHSTGEVRGLLCTNCNRALAALKDRPELLREAALYLERRR